MKRLLIGLLVLALMLPLTFLGSQEKNALASTNSFNVGTVQVSSNGTYVKVENMMMMETADQKKIVAFDLNFVNGGNQDINFIDYWVRLKSKAGASFTIQQVKNDSSNNVIVARSNKVFSFYAYIADNVKVTDLQVEMVQWDFSQPNYERKLGTVTVPATYSFVTAENSAKSITVGSSQLDIKVKSFTQYNSGEGLDINLEFTAVNNGSRAVTLPKYNYYLVSEGRYYELTLNETADVMIQPKVDKAVKLSGNIPMLDNKQFTFVIVEKTEEIELPKAYFKVTPSDDEVATVQPGQVYQYAQGDTLLQSFITNVIKENNSVTIYYQVDNVGLASVETPEYSFELTSDEGLKLPMTIQSGGGKLTIAPQSSRQIQLTAELGSTLPESSLKLQVHQKDTSTSVLKQFRTFELPNQSFTTKNAEYTNKNGKYTFTLKNIQRLPKGNEDLIIAELSIKNEGNVAQALINVNGYFMLDGMKVTSSEAKFLTLDNVINIQPQESINMISYITVPYTYNFSNISLHLEEQEGENSVKRITDFRSTYSAFNTSKIAVGNALNIESIGTRASVKVGKINTYIDNHTKLLNTEVEIENLEKRYNELPQIMAYYRTVDDIYFPATLTEYKEKVMPNGKLLLNVWSVMPASYNLEDLELIVGIAVPGSSSDEFYKASVLLLPEEVATLKKANRIEISPYTIEMSNVIATVLSEERKIKFDYTLTRDNYYSNAPTGHTLLIEIVDKDDNLTFEQELKLEDASGLQLGSNSKEFTYPFKNVLNNHGMYTINVYDKFEGYKKLIASDLLSWGKVEYFKNN